MRTIINAIMTEHNLPEKDDAVLSMLNGDNNPEFIPE